jgi:hypothetical protein
LKEEGQTERVDDPDFDAWLQERLIEIGRQFGLDACPDARNAEAAPGLSTPRRRSQRARS